MFKKLNPAPEIIDLDLIDTDRIQNFRARRGTVQDLMRSYYPGLLNSKSEKDNYKKTLAEFEDTLRLLYGKKADLDLDLREEEYFADLFDEIFPTDNEKLDQLRRRILDVDNKIEEILLKREQYRALSDISRLNIVSQSQKHSRSRSRASRKVRQKCHKRSRQKRKRQ